MILAFIETVHTARGVAKMAKSRKVKAKAARKAKAGKPTHAEQYAIPTSVSDRGTYERWVQQVGVEVVDEANVARREVFPALRLHDRVIDAGGRVVAQGSVSRFEHPALDVMFEARIFDDPADPERATHRLTAGVALLDLAKVGKVLGKSTTAWGAVGGGSRGIVSAVQAESLEAHAEMKYLRAKDAVGAADWDLVRMVCIDGIVPRSISRSRLCNALDNLAEYLNIAEPPATVKRPPRRAVPPLPFRRSS